jgi:hypothetical protein
MSSTRELRHLRRRRLQSHHPEIATALLGEATGESKTHWRFDNWFFHKVTGAYFNRDLKIGGYDSITLVCALRNCSRRSAVEWLRAWEASHGHDWGSADGVVDDHDNGRGDEDDDDPDVVRRARKASEIDERKLDGPSAVGGPWLARRGLEGAYDPAEVWHLPTNVARPGDAAILFPLYARTTLVGYEINYLDVTTGQRSPVRPQRYAAYTVRNFSGPVAFIPFDPPAGFKAPSDGTVQLCEGWCDMKSLQLVL